ncbi:MAG: Uma2 family endonuclease [Saprospiraceae bacterium]
MADNTRQWNWINFIKNGLEETTANQVIFVAGDLLWYPVEGNNKLRVAPDVMVAIGRPKGDRNSYLQWREANLPPQIAFEVLSPGNTKKEMAKKLLWYEKYGVIEYYVYDPDSNKLEIYNRTADKLIKIDTKDWTSHLLKFRLLWTTDTLKIFHPNGTPFLSYAEVIADVKSAKTAVTTAKAKMVKIKVENKEIKIENKEIKIENEEVKSENEEVKSENKKVRAENEAIKLEAKKAKEEAALLAAKLKSLGIDPTSLI